MAVNGSGGLNRDYNEFRVIEVLVESGSSAAVALRVEAVWGTRSAEGEPAVWDRSVFVVAAVGALAGADVGDRLELLPAANGG